MNSDQNFIALSNGNVIRARAMVRTIPSARWQPSRMNSIIITPLTERMRSGTFDAIEESDKPHEALRDPEDAVTDPRRVPIMKQDLAAYGYTPRCPNMQCILFRI